MSIPGRLAVYLGLGLIAVLLSLGTVYGYGQWFSHDRYWHGTIARVQENQAELVRGLLSESSGAAGMSVSQERIAKMFSALDNQLVVEVYQRGKRLYSNENHRFARGAPLDQISLAQGVEVRVSRYQPPAWDVLFVRWLKSPSRWLEPSFDHITYPFLWFLGIHGMALVVLGLIVKSRYLEGDVLAVLHRIESERAE